MEKEERGTAPYIGIYIQIRALFVLSTTIVSDTIASTTTTTKKSEKIERGFNYS